MGYKQTQLYYYFLKSTYFVKFLFKKQNKKVVNFKDLKEITFIRRDKLLNLEVGFSFKPKTKNQDEDKVFVAFDECFAYRIGQSIINSQSSTIYVKQNNTLYFERFKNDESFLYNSKILKKYISNKAIVEVQEFGTEFERGFFLGGTFIFNYYHFLVEIVSKVSIVKELYFNNQNYPILIDKSVNDVPVFREISKLFLKDFNVIFLDSNKSYKVKDLWYITNPNTSPFDVKKNFKIKAEYTKTRPNTIKYIREKAIENIPLNIKMNKYDKIFLSRKTKNRRYNQDEVFEHIKKLGFIEIYFEDYSFFEQVFIMQNANFIAGGTGAAWTNLIFAKKNARGLIWMNKIWGEISVFSNLASIVDFDLNYYITKNETSDFHSDYYIDPKIIENKILKLVTDA